MKRVEVAPTAVAEFLAQNTRHIEGRAEQSAGEKKVEGAKKFVLDWLIEHRKIDVAKLPMGETVHVQIPVKGGLADCFTIARTNGGMKIDVKEIEAKEPKVAARFRRQYVNTSLNAVPQ